MNKTKATFQFLRFTSKGFRSGIGLISFIGLAEVALSLAFVWFSKTIIDVATGENKGNLLYYSILLVTIVVLQILLRLWDIRLSRMTEVRMGNYIRYNVFSRLLYTRWQELSSMHSGDMLTRIIKDTDDVVNVMVTAIPLTVAAFIQFIGALIILFILDPILALILGVGMPVLALFGKLYYTRMRKYTVEVKESESLITSMMEESLLNQIVIRTFERQDNELNRLEKLQSKLHKSVHKRTNVSVIANMMMGFTFNGGYITAFIWSAYGLAKKTITFGTVTAYLQLVNRIQRPIFDLIRLLPSIVSAKTAIDRLIYLTEFKLEDIKEKKVLTGNVTLRIENITFAYSKDVKPVLTDFSMVVEPGTMVAVMGETGVGKTTLLRLLLALVKPDSGKITIENEMESVAISERTRSNFVYVPQGNSLFSGTIRENLLLGDLNADDNELRRVLKIASAEFVFDLPEGLDTILGENGSGLSEGQAQRVAIARSLLRPGKVLLLDEATSALDSETEQTFLRNLKSEIGNRTILFITHQSQVASFCDHTYYLTS
ncbi:MAG: ABC transporter ATP-binding protein [Fermentimonas sp.]|nr:ABC transporter ATP-binding protein [Fermentimonas sp.]NLC87109.1 ABC transporter ATP-binding protein [Bacteroidales bacterium]MDD2931551.1 ABC transporter ATP-binding protein [Fermentimonas sp.]MDD3510948.1 ABC transporter ATP-binding protein [Fermentimonas sp.]MDD4283862.1 ABC transporter ATP-binding protein [Fermentimonas sp.]